MKSARRINPLSDEAVSYAAYAWDSAPASAQVILIDAIKNSKLKDNIPFEEFDEYVRSFLKEEPVHKSQENSAYAFWSVIVGLVSWFTWLLPVCGFPVSGIGISLGVIALKSQRRNLAILGIVFSMFGFLAVTANSAAGAYLGYTGELFNPSLSPTPRVTSTSYRPPTITPAPVSSSPTSSSTCLLWSQVTSSMAGRTVCVYGTVIEYRENWENYISNLYFGTRDQFYLVSNYRWDDSPKGDCVTATGEVQLNTYKVPYIKIEDQLDSCQ